MNRVIVIFLLILIILIIVKVSSCSQNKQESFRKSLRDMDTTLSQNNIEYFLICGTALGAIREKKFISHDKDIDIGCFIDLNRILKAMKNNKNFSLLRYFPNDKPISQATELTFCHKINKVNIDIFNVIKTPEKYIFYSYTSLCDTKPNKRCEFHVRPFTIIDAEILGDKYKSVDENFLVDQYGEDWKIPKKFGYGDGLKNNHYKSLQ